MNDQLLISNSVYHPSVECSSTGQHYTYPATQSRIATRFARDVLDKQVCEIHILIDLTHPVTLMVEPLNGMLWQEYLNWDELILLEDDLGKIDACRIHYKLTHSALGRIIPSLFAEKHADRQHNSGKLKPLISGCFLKS